VQEGSPITLNTEAGYVLAASVDAVYVFNVSTLYQTQGNPIFVGKRELYYAEHEETSNHDQQQKQQHRPLSVHTTASFKGQKWVVALAQDGRSAVGYEAFFYYSEDVDFDFLSLRGPLFVMGLIAVFIWNLYKKKQNGGGGSGGRGRGGPDQLPQDLMRQFEQMEQKFKSSQLTAGRGNRLGRTPRGY
jgi:hypothetical protein